MTHITTRRLRIEALRREHAAPLYAALADPSIYAYIPDDPPASADALASHYARLAEGAPAHSGQIWLNWAIRLRGSRTYVGTLQATVLRDRTASIAYVLAPPHRGQGYATEACRWLLGHLAIERRVVGFQATTDVRNDASWRLLECLGFVRIGEELAQCHGETVTDFRYRLDPQREELRSIFLELRKHLDHAKSLLNEEIRSYPTPIPRCDAQFNALYEQRARLSQRLAGADAILEGGAAADGLVDAIAAYIDASRGCGDAMEDAIVARLRAGICGADRDRAASPRGATPGL